MLDKRKFTISIGEYGVMVALHNGSNVQNKILVAALNEENKVQLRDLFTKNKSVSIYVLIDTADQNYKRTSYPPVSESDFHKIVKRDINKELNDSQKTFKSYYGYKDKIQNKWECIFISVPYSLDVENWIEFLLGLPNKFVGIYMLPIETCHLAKTVFDFIKADHSLRTNENSIISFIVQNKVSGVRQVVFFNNAIVFTRVVNYDFDDRNFAQKFEQDIFRANEYLKMIFPKLKAQDVTVINILSDEIIEKIKHSANHELNFINYSPFQIASKLGMTNVIAKNNSNFSDIIIANSFANNNKKAIKFLNPRITFLSRLELIVKSMIVFNCVIAAGILLMFTKIIIQAYQYSGSMSKLKHEIIQLEQQLQSISSAALDLDKKGVVGKKLNKSSNDLANEIIDFGKVDEALSKFDINIANVFTQLTLIKKYGAIVNSFAYQIPDYNPKLESSTTQGKFSISGDLSDPSGDIEMLFRKFDNLGLDTKTQLPGYNIKYSEISKNIDFGQKYYSFPFDLTIENKMQGNSNGK